MSQHQHHASMHHPPNGEPGQVAVTVVACLVILLVFIVIAALV